MAGPIVETLKDIAGRWLMRGARIPKEHPFEDPHPHPASNVAAPATHSHATPSPAPVSPVPSPVPTSNSEPATAPGESTGTTPPPGTTASGRAWTGDMRQIPPHPGGEVGDQIVASLRTCFDPEIPVNIYELGLIYNIEIDDDQNAWVVMTLTSPMCPVAGSLPPEVEGKVSSVEGVKSAKVDVVWDPPWTPDMMSEAAKLDLGML